MNAETPFPTTTRSRIRTKSLVPVDLVLNDGTRLSGDLYVGVGQRVLDMLNAAPVFIPYRTADQGVMIIAKNSIAICQPLGEMTNVSLNQSPADAPPAEEDMSG